MMRRDLPSATSSPRGKRRLRPQFERMESRRLLATFSVTSDGDSGAGTLREAIAKANAKTDLDTINFAIGSGPRTIAPLSALPIITSSVIIDGTSQPGNDPTNPDPIIRLSGQNITGPGVSGFDFQTGSNGSQIQGLIIQNFTSSGLIFRSTTGNTIGRAVAGAGNLISGNGDPGIQIEGGGSDVIQGNVIGLSSARDDGTGLGNKGSA